jgi:hypothetical protein
MANWTNPNVSQVVPIIQGGSLASSSIVATITPSGGYQVFSMTDVSAYQSYDLNTYMYAATPGAGSPVVALYQLLWFDDLTSGIPVFEEQWWIWCGRAAAGFSDCHAATGPMHGRYMTVNVSIPVAATSNAILQYFNLFGSPRTTQWSDWRQDAFEVNPATSGITLQSASTSGYENSICNAGNIALGASANVWIPCALYAGPVYYRYQSTAAALHDPVIAAADNIVSGGIVIGTGNPFVLVNMAADATEHEGTFIAPRAPCFFVVQAPVAGFTFSLNMTAQQAA